MRRILLLSCLLMAACGNSGTFNFSKKDPSVKPLTKIETKLAFTCKHETIPEPSAKSDVLFQYARWLQKTTSSSRTRPLIPRLNDCIASPQSMVITRPTSTCRTAPCEAVLS
ncbi:hypothetical protein [Pseudomonas sp. Z6-14]|uniref:hypothetical protein n=1 Tax=Pseudomonas sp. Z6-14 TaxID=2817416 RepID=UPI003DAA1CE6